MNTDNRISIRPIVKALENAFDALNARFYDGAINPPCITVAEGSTRSARGWVTVFEVWHQNDNSAYELNVSGDYLNRPAIDVATTLAHEMVHLENLRLGIQDTARNGIRHNKKFAETAEKHGMIHIKRDDFDKVGFSGVEFPAELHDEVLTLCADLVKELTIYRDANIKGEKKKAKSTVLKYVCPVCGNSCRATKPISIMCMDCDEPMNIEQ